MPALLQITFADSDLFCTQCARFANLTPKFAKYSPILETLLPAMAKVLLRKILRSIFSRNLCQSEILLKITAKCTFCSDLQI
jgi:hypothetical protein